MKREHESCDCVRGDSNIVNPDAATIEKLAAVEAALRRLPCFTRDIFLSHRIEDLSYAEIAALSGISVKRVESEMARAIITIYRELNDPTPSGRWWHFWQR